MGAWKEEVDTNYISNKEQHKLTPNGKLGLRAKEELKELYYD